MSGAVDGLDVARWGAQRDEHSQAELFLLSCRDQQDVIEQEHSVEHFLRQLCVPEEKITFAYKKSRSAHKILRDQLCEQNDKKKVD
jgi:hypothetical protein